MELAELQNVFSSFITLPANFPSQFPPGSFIPQKYTKKHSPYSPPHIPYAKYIYLAQL